MHLVTFIKKDAHLHDESCSQEERWGIWQPHAAYVVDAVAADATLPRTLRHVVEDGEAYVPRLKHLFEKDAQGSLTRLSMEDVRLRAPYTNPPRNIICTGINYAEHQQEFIRSDAKEQKLPEFPFLFTKPCTAIAHPNTAVDRHATLTDKYDYEVELAVIIGKKGRDIAKNKAFDHVFGYTIINDLSARDLQKRTSQWYTGKSLDTSAPLGPCILHKSALEDPQNLRITSRINGELRQNSHTSHMIFPVATLIHIISQGTTLLPGDIIATGTPAGVGMGLKPPQFLQSGDVMELEIEHIGVLKNTVK